jgi:beta-mannosidase
VPRFCSEFGQQSPPDAFQVHPDALDPHDEELTPQDIAFRQRATGGIAKHIDELLADWYPVPSSAWHWSKLARSLQARALRIGIEWMRIHRPRCMGAMIWQFNSAWAGVSWSIVESGGSCKPAWTAVRQAFAPRILTIQPMNGRLTVFGVNDSAEPWEGRFRIMRRSTDGTLTSDMVFHDVSVAAWGTAALTDVESSIGSPDDPKREFILAQTDSEEATWYYVNPKDRLRAIRGSDWDEPHQ